MQYSKELTLRVREEPWQCMECKKCNICKDQGEAVCSLLIVLLLLSAYL